MKHLIITLLLTLSASFLWAQDPLFNKYTSQRVKEYLEEFSHPNNQWMEITRQLQEKPVTLSDLQQNESAQQLSQGQSFEQAVDKIDDGDLLDEYLVPSKGFTVRGEERKVYHLRGETAIQLYSDGTFLYIPGTNRILHRTEAVPFRFSVIQLK
ncbi:hypothetical protein V6R21_12960 [Limibacter armeniacum]|uniref:hypothetical protein n=1 Tax=Limibacter armeniacum TaxID=466084 RepID=UPI002FE65BB9